MTISQALLCFDMSLSQRFLADSHHVTHFNAGVVSELIGRKLLVCNQHSNNKMDRITRYDADPSGLT